MNLLRPSLSSASFCEDFRSASHVRRRTWRRRRVQQSRLHQSSLFNVLITSPRSPGYDAAEEYYEEPEPQEYDPDDEPLPTEDTEVRDNDESNIVASGDLQAAASAGKGKKEPKIKKIPDNERKTTPYMTKYEKARILGTRALQIRYVLDNGRVNVGEG